MQATQRLGNVEFYQSKTVGRFVTVNELMVDIRSDIPFFEESGGGVTLTGGEPLAQPSFAIALLHACKNEGIHTVLDTCGYAPPEVIEQTIPITDVYLFDLKLANSQEHKKYTGVGNELILKNLALLSKQGQIITIRIPLVEGITDSAENIDGLKSIIKSTKGIQRIDLLPYHSMAKHKFKQCNRHYALNDMENYPIAKVEEVAHSLDGLAPFISIGG